VNILVSDVWSVYNAGDRAILESLLDGLLELYPDARITVCAHFPDGCRDIGRIEVLPDVLAFDEASYLAQLGSLQGADASVDAVRHAYSEADLVVSTGGYFLTGVPANDFTYVFLSRLLHLSWATEAGVPTAVLGQSIGPIESAELRQSARGLFSAAGFVGVRDVESFSFLHRSGLAPRARLTADLAVSLAPAPQHEVDEVLSRLDLSPGALGISVRHYPGTPSHFFEHVARVADRAVRELDLDVLLIGTTAPPANAPEVRERERALGNDDTVALSEVFDLMQEKGRARVSTDNLPPRLLKGVLGTCHAFLGTRMHASILATTAGVPAAGIAYEYKVRGWFERLGMADLVSPLQTADEEALWHLTEQLTSRNDELRRHLDRAVPLIQEASLDNYRGLAELVAPTRKVPSRPSPSEVKADSDTTLASDPRRAWETESTHYDVLHQRLQRIVEIAETSGGSRLLDVGCSAGTIGAALSPGWTYHGCDISEAAVRSATRGWLVAADLEAGVPAFDGRPYDVVICSGILEYLEDPGAILTSLTERVAPDGVLVVSYFNMRHLSRRGPDPYRHSLWRNDLSPAAFRDALGASGWVIEAKSWSTAGLGSAPDVRDEGAVLSAEPADAATRLDDIGHTLIYPARPASATRAGERQAHLAGVHT
jgi:colanic acid/amylovoran biosynthesis protein